jgi:integrase
MHCGAEVISVEYLHEVSERLGHATVAFTLDTYSHVVPGLQEAAAKAFDESLRNDNNVKEVR